MARPKDDSQEARATRARLALPSPKERQGKARLREAAALCLANAKAQEREALNAFRALPLKDKIRLVGLSPARPAPRPGRAAVRFAATIARAIMESTKHEKAKDSRDEK